jgi:DnaJ family protein C protein 17
MGDENKDLMRYASEYADKNIDLYDVLSVDALTPKEEIQRAWRKRSIMYHPDKAGANFDAEKWELLERARDVLADPNARATYDAGMKAKLLRKQEREAMDKERKKFADDLEARENLARRQEDEAAQRGREMMEKERERLSEVNRMREEENQRAAAAAQEMEDLAEARRRVKEKKDEKARRKQAKESLKGSAVGKRPTGPTNGTVFVPGNYVVDAGADKKKYWELVCDKLQVMQAARNLHAARNLQPPQATAEEVQEAERNVHEVRRMIHEAELKYEAEAASL